MYPNETRPDLHLKPHDKIVDTYTPSTNININTSQARSMHQRKKGEEEEGNISSKPSTNVRSASRKNVRLSISSLGSRNDDCRSRN